LLSICGLWLHQHALSPRTLNAGKVCFTLGSPNMSEPPPKACHWMAPTPRFRFFNRSASPLIYAFLEFCLSPPLACPGVFQLPLAVGGFRPLTSDAEDASMSSPHCFDFNNHPLLSFFRETHRTSPILWPSRRPWATPALMFPYDEVFWAIRRL